MAVLIASVAEIIWIAAYVIPRWHHIKITGHPDFTPSVMAHLFIELLPLFLGTFLANYLYNIPKYAIDGVGTAKMQTVFNVLFMSLYNPDLKYLAEQLDSIAAQDFDDFEVVVYNDNPIGDDLSAFCRDHLGKKPLRYFATKKNRGYVKAFEHLVSLANGRCLAFCDQDDLWAPSRLSAGVKALSSGALLVTCDRKIISADDKILCESWRHSHPTFPETS